MKNIKTFKSYINEDLKSDYEKWKNVSMGDNDIVEDVSPVTDVTNTINVEVLQGILDERDGVVVGDVVIATYFMGSYNTYEFEVINGSPDEPISLGNLGNSGDMTWYDLEHAFHVVKKETYNSRLNETP